MPLLAAAIVGIGLLLGWRGVDLPAQLYRVANFRAHGLAMWDGGWFGGNWTLGYSVLFPAIADVFGLAAVTVAAAAVAALAFDRIAVDLLGTDGCPAAIVFAAGTAVQSAIGQLPFLAGEALGLCACWAASRNRWTAAGALALGASLMSPLAGVFLVIGMSGWGLSRWPLAQHRTEVVRAGAVVVAAGLPIGVSAVLFPGEGIMPYPVVDYAWEMAIAAGIWILAGRRRRAVRTGILVYAVVATGAWVIPSPVGGNVGRLEDVLALPLAVAFLWPRRGLWRQLVLPAVAVPLVLSQWGPAWGAMTTNAGQPSTHRSFFAPLDGALTRAAAGGPAGRVEVVPTEFHWESVYVSPVMPLARGWERQLDVSNNPLFYGDSARLDAVSYRAWLLDNGVRFVAVANAPLDFAGRAEARVIGGGVPGLRLTWQSADWRLYQVEGSGGIVLSPAHLLSASGDTVRVFTPRQGPVLVRVRYSPRWKLVSDAGCVAPSVPGKEFDGAATWMIVTTSKAGPFELRLSVLPGQDGCSGRT
jgi:hypothetical protein